MDTIDILTGQHVTIQYQPASVARRIAAFLCDFTFIALYMTIWTFLYSELLDFDLFYADAAGIILYTIFSLPALCYHVFFETMLDGQTPGKMLLKIRVSNLDGSTPHFVAYFLRWLLLVVDMMPYGGLGTLLILFTKNHQRVGDLAAGTTVIMITPASQFSFEKTFDVVEADYKPTFPEVELLTEGQIRLINDLLKEPDDQSKVKESLRQLSVKIKEKLQIESEEDDRTFLKRVTQDYIYYTSQGV